MSKIHNYAGVKAAERENGYSGRLEAIDKDHAVENIKGMTPKANLFIALGFSFMDFTVLFSIFDACITQSEFMGRLMAFGIAFALNILPLIIAKLAHQAIYKIKQHALTMLFVCTTAFVILFAATVILRFAYSDMYETENQTVQLENMVSDDTDAEEAEDSDGGKSLAVVIVLSLSPLITSVIGFALAYISDDEVRRRLEYYERRDIELDEAISDLEAAIVTMNSDMERDLKLDEELMEATIGEIYARADTLKALARQYLAEYLARPDATSKLSAEMMVKKDGDAEPTGKDAALKEVMLFKREQAV